MGACARAHDLLVPQGLPLRRGRGAPPTARGLSPVRTTALLLALGASACSSASREASDGPLLVQFDAGSSASPSPSGQATGVLPSEPDYFQALGPVDAQLDTVCARGLQNTVTAALCARPSLRNLSDLLAALGLGFRDRSSRGANGTGGNPAFALLGHSSSLVVRSVSAINPRALIFSSPAGGRATPGYVALGFVRGEHFVELAAHSRADQSLTFYLLKYEQACTAQRACTNADKLSPAVEQGWTGWTLYQDEDLKNTPLDCRHCHQPGGPSSPPLLRMQELRDPWTHFFRNDRPGGIALLDDFHAAHGNGEDYGGIPAALIDKSDGRALEDLVVLNGFGNQPNAFDSRTIEAEVRRASSAQPSVNLPVGTSATWQALYDASTTGRFIPVPYHDVKVTDPGRLAEATRAYRALVAGTLAPGAMPDARSVFLEDALPDMSLRPRPGLAGRELLVQMCAQCHNGNLDSSLSRARFDATRIESLSAGERELAVQRISLPESDPRHMPPSLFRSWTDQARSSAVTALRAGL